MTQALNDAENNLSKQLLLLYIYIFTAIFALNLSRRFSVYFEVLTYIY